MANAEHHRSFHRAGQTPLIAGRPVRAELAAENGRELVSGARPSRPRDRCHMPFDLRRRFAVGLLGTITLGILAAACASNASPGASSSDPTTMTEYVGGHWIPFESSTGLAPAQWAVVDAYASFSSAVLAVYSTQSVAPLATVSSSSMTEEMFSRDLTSGVHPEALYDKVVVESVSIHGCRARLSLLLSYPGGRNLHYVSSWVLPYDKAALARARRVSGAKASLSVLLANQYAPWLFVGDNEVGGEDTPCGV